LIAAHLPRAPTLEAHPTPIGVEVLVKERTIPLNASNRIKGKNLFRH
jgi:hypothetical protein